MSRAFSAHKGFWANEPRAALRLPWADMRQAVGLRARDVPARAPHPCEFLAFGGNVSMYPTPVFDRFSTCMLTRSA